MAAYPDISWKEGELEKGLKELQTYAVAFGEGHRGYYQRNAHFKRSWAKALRVTAILSGAVGGLLPILSQITKGGSFYIDPAWATVAITIAITAIGFDRFFGFSSAWMRFVTTEIKIESKTEQLRIQLENEKFSWQGKPPTFDTAKATLAIIVAYLNEVSEIVKDETNTWMVEFQNVLQKFNEEMNVKAESSKLGGIRVTVENGEKCNEGLVVHLEGQQPISFHGSSYSFNNLYPKIYRVSVTGTITETKEGETVKQSLQDETLANVGPGAVVDVTLKLK